MADLIDVARAASVLMQQIALDPQSAGVKVSAEQMIQSIDEFLASPDVTAMLRVPAEHRAALTERISPNARRVFANLRDALNVSLQLQELGGRVEWAAALREGMERFADVFARVGVFLDPSAMPAPPMVTHSIGDDGRPEFRIVVERARRPHLEPYIALALQRAVLSELEPGHWFAELEGFAGVWADGASPEECLVGLADVLHEWLIIKFVQGDQDLPVLGNLDPRMLIILPG